MPRLDVELAEGLDRLEELFLAAQDTRKNRHLSAHDLCGELIALIQGERQENATDYLGFFGADKKSTLRDVVIQVSQRYSSLVSALEEYFDASRPMRPIPPPPTEPQAREQWNEREEVIEQRQSRNGLAHAQTEMLNVICRISRELRMGVEVQGNDEEPCPPLPSPDDFEGIKRVDIVDSPDNSETRFTLIFYFDAGFVASSIHAEEVQSTHLRRRLFCYLATHFLQAIRFSTLSSAWITLGGNSDGGNSISSAVSRLNDEIRCFGLEIETSGRRQTHSCTLRFLNPAE